MKTFTLVIDGRKYAVDAEGKNLLHTCLSLGLNLPYFCWHPALHSVGACRQCAVKQFRDEKDTQGRIIMACMTPVTAGMRISVDDPEAKAFRARVVGWLMTSHPHDCPICDEGGECHLQDMTVLTGHNYRAYRFKKATFNNQYLGPFLNHEMNRCIECYRCVRFYRDYAGGRDLNVFGSRDRIYFGRSEEGVLENEFAGNLVEVCPTGVFTDKPFKRHYTRKWDLRTAPSVCVHCGLGCNTIAGERYGGLRRILNRFNGQVNGHFLCDRGRFGYGFVNSEKRVLQPLHRTSKGAAAVPESGEAALERLAPLFSGDGARRWIGIGSPRASLESNFALRELVGPDRFFSGMGGAEARLAALVLKILREGPARTPSLAEVERCDAVLVLGEDVTQSAPRLALSLRQSVRQEPLKIADRLGIPRWNDAMVREALQDAKGPVFVAAVGPTRLDDAARETHQACPDGLARLGCAVARAIDGSAPQVQGLDADVLALVDRIAQALKASARPLVVSGMGLGSEAVVRAAADVAAALCRAGKPAALCLAVPEANTLGAAFLGGAPLETAQEILTSGAADSVIIVENDLLRRLPASRVVPIFAAAQTIVLVDHLLHGTSERAGMVLPAATFAEGSGTFVSAEGRAQRFFQVFVPVGTEIQESWCWIRDLLLRVGRQEARAWAGLDEILAALGRAVPALAKAAEAAPGASFRLDGQRIPRESHRSTGRTAITANLNVSEPKPPEDAYTPFSFTMEGSRRDPPPELIQRFWAPSWNSGQSLHKFQAEAGGPLRGGDPGVRLIEPASPSSAPSAPYSGPPDPEPPLRPGEFLVLAAAHIFGSDELSALAPAVAELSPRPYLALGPADAEAAGVKSGDMVDLAVPGALALLAARIVPGLAPGVAILPAGLGGVPWQGLPARGRITRRPSA